MKERERTEYGEMEVEHEDLIKPVSKVLPARMTTEVSSKLRVTKGRAYGYKVDKKSIIR